MLRMMRAGVTLTTDKSWFRRHPWRTGILLIVCGAAAFFVYLCLPHGYRKLEQLESRLEQLTAQGARIGDVRDDDLRIGKISPNRDDRLEAVHLRHLQVHQHDIRAMRTEPLDGLAAVRGFGD